LPGTQSAIALRRPALAARNGKSLSGAFQLERWRQERHVVMEAGITRGMPCSYEKGRQCPSLANPVGVLTALDCSAEEFGSHPGPWG
jgi:hypothetical protein